MKNHHFFLLALISYSALAGPERKKPSINYCKDYVSYRNIILGQQADQIQSREKEQWAEMVDQKTLQNYEMINIHLDSANKFLRQTVITLTIENNHLVAKITENNHLVAKNNQLEKQINELQNKHTELETVYLIQCARAAEEKKNLVLEYDAKIKEKTYEIHEEKKRNKTLQNPCSHQWYSPFVYIGTGVLFTILWNKLPSFGKGPMSPK